MNSAAHIHSLHIYPVKSCAGIALQEIGVVATGFEHDREWMVVTPDGRFLTQRDLPKMALIQVRIAAGMLALEIPGGLTERVPLDHGGERRDVIVWRSQCPAFDAGDAMAALLSGWLERPARLVRFDAAHQRLSNQDFTAGIRAPNLFSDAFPLLVLSRASLADLNRRMGRELPMNRFRPNIVLDGVEPYAEDAGTELVAGPVALRLAKPCVRCVITTTDQATAQRDGDEPLRTLKTYRHDRELRGVLFGRNAVIQRGQGTVLRCGDPVVLR